MNKKEIYVFTQKGEMINLKDRDLIVREYSDGWRIIARNSESLTEQEKKELINALFGEE